MSGRAPRRGSESLAFDPKRLKPLQRAYPFESPADLEGFFRACDALEGPEREPDWAEHRRVILESRRRGTPSP